MHLAVRDIRFLRLWKGTWHQVQAAYPIDSRMGLLRRSASARASGPHCHQSTGLSLCCNRYGLVESASRFAITVASPDRFHWCRTIPPKVKVVIASDRYSRPMTLFPARGFEMVDDLASTQRRASPR